MKHLALAYPAEITYDEEGYYVKFIDFDIITEGSSLDEAISNAQEALDVTLLGFVETGQALPPITTCKAKNIYWISASS
jgi:predicted RNase H-like HicB family nuclease